MGSYRRAMKNIRKDAEWERQTRERLPISEQTDNSPSDLGWAYSGHARTVPGTDREGETPTAHLTPPQVQGTAFISVADEVAKLAKLHSDGILTDAEFQEQKRRVLAQGTQLTAGAQSSMSKNGPPLAVEPPHLGWGTEGSLGTVRAGTPEKYGDTAIDNSRAWLLAFAPLLILCADVAWGVNGFWVGLFVAVAVNWTISAWDQRYLRSHGVSVNDMSSFFVPGYLYKRSNVLRQRQALLVVWIGTLAVSLAMSAS